MSHDSILSKNQGQNFKHFQGHRETADKVNMNRTNLSIKCFAFPLIYPSLFYPEGKQHKCADPLGSNSPSVFTNQQTVQSGNFKNLHL